MRVGDQPCFTLPGLRFSTPVEIKSSCGVVPEKLLVCSRFFNWPEEAGTGYEILAIGEEDKLLTSHFLINS